LVGSPVDPFDLSVLLVDFHQEQWAVIESLLWRDVLLRQLPELPT